MNQTEKQNGRKEEIPSYTMSDRCQRHHWPQEVHANPTPTTPGTDSAQDRASKSWAVHTHKEATHKPHARRSAASMGHIRAPFVMCVARHTQGSSVPGHTVSPDPRRAQDLPNKKLEEEEKRKKKKKI